MEEKFIPAIVSIEDLKSAQKEGLRIYAMPHALCGMVVAIER
jgi:hypothetical protein